MKLTLQLANFLPNKIFKNKQIAPKNTAEQFYSVTKHVPTCAE